LIYNVIAFYLDHRAAVDDDISQCQSEIETHRAGAVSGPGLEELRNRLAAAQSTGAQ
jgi:hypothetical protein